MSAWGEGQRVPIRVLRSAHAVTSAAVQRGGKHGGIWRGPACKHDHHGWGDPLSVSALLRAADDIPKV